MIRRKREIPKLKEKKVKKGVKLIFILLAAIFLIYFCLVSFVNIKGKSIVINRVKKEIGVKADIESVSFKFPFGIKITKFSCGDFSFDEANVSLNLSNKLDLKGLKAVIIVDNNKVYVDSLTTKKGIKTSYPKEAKTSDSKQSKSKKTKKKKTLFSFKKIQVRESQISLVYINKNKTKVFNLGNVNLRLDNFKYPKLDKFQVKFSASLLSAFEKGVITDRLSVNGWVDYPKKSMDCSLDILNFDYIAFGKEYMSGDIGEFAAFIHPKNFMLEKATLSLKSYLVSENNDLSIDITLALEEINFQKLKGEDDISKIRTAKTIIAFLKAGKDKPTLNFKIKTKMDSPELDLSFLKKTVKNSVKISFGTALENLVDRVKEDVTKEFKGSKSLDTHAVIDTFKSVVDTIAESFKFKTKGRK